ncbi:alcohol dehydrogenase catalytic domain-containing protein [Alteromonas sp. KUL49]|uniref:zinc-dependent alcohol dehydrogenase n=1 Tax=Alteromonas sp. KUL49 TaxID=2480798 RepID=UPI00102F25DB|nr:alcohol dehydrogenase catalytic domain-containing protein [Alteromonas sp. KUL49]TAP40124.1 Zn-dependent alcohol dehydrogenase [Alteromonas sp. KUL49]GEA11237.1 Zn-dependent alcohol dehydrogenase [Alteromonas sp. KUL49]
MFAAQYTGNKSFSIQSGASVPPGEGEVRLDVGYVGICGTDMHIYHGAMDARVAPPQIIGHEMSGIVAELGEGVTDFAVGDKVVVRPLDYCGECPACKAGHSHVCQNLKFMGIDTPGAFQSSWTVKARTLHKLPSGVTLKMGALVEPLSVACHDVSRANVTAGEHVVVIGGGPIGQLIALVAKAKGATVLLSEVSAPRREFAEKYGIETIDPLNNDIVAFVKEWSGNKGADAVFEVSGVQPAVDVMADIAAVRGRICMVAIHTQKPNVDLFAFFWKELQLVGARVYEYQDFEDAIALIAENKFNLEPFVSSVSQIQNIADAFSNMDGNPSGMKALVSLQGEE